MYNRYIPQPDGSFRRSRIQDQPAPCPPTAPCPPPEPSYPPQEPSCPPPEAPCPPRNPSRPSQGCKPRRPPEHHEAPGLGGFLRRLLPGDFDTGDLMIVLLLLLMAGDCQEDQNTALLTLALYLFL